MCVKYRVCLTLQVFAHIDALLSLRLIGAAAFSLLICCSCCPDKVEEPPPPPENLIISTAPLTGTNQRAAPTRWTDINVAGQLRVCPYILAATLLKQLPANSDDGCGVAGMCPGQRGRGAESQMCGSIRSGSAGERASVGREGVGLRRGATGLSDMFLLW